MKPLPPTTMLLGMKAVRLTMLSNEDVVVTRATGFFVNEAEGIFLYTCWHVVTGYDFLNLKPQKGPDRRRIVVDLQDVQVRQPGVTAIGGNKQLVINLFDGVGNPVWQQEAHTRGTVIKSGVPIEVPARFDVVRLAVDLPIEICEVIVFPRECVYRQLVLSGDDVVVIGYPYGFSAMLDHSPEPIFQKRAIASIRTNEGGMMLLDGGCAPSMSGAPVVFRNDAGWWLYGIYTGIVFPDHVDGSTLRENDRHASLGLIAGFYIARGFMNVPGIYD